MAGIQNSDAEDSVYPRLCIKGYDALMLRRLGSLITTRTVALGAKGNDFHSRPSTEKPFHGHFALINTMRRVRLFGSEFSFHGRLYFYSINNPDDS